MRQNATALFALVVGLSACRSVWSEWSARDPGREGKYARVVDSASRVRSPDAACDGAERETLGVARADGPTDEVVPALAAVAAAHGGTHYVIESDRESAEDVTTGVGVRTGDVVIVRTHTRQERSRATWAVVFRCPAK